MYKLAILGCENSHANNFLRTVITEKKYDDIEFVGVYSDDREAAEKLSREFGVPVAEDYTAFVGQIDGLLITARHGDNHYKYAKPYIESGIPMFIDKPVTISGTEAVTFMKELKANHVRITGGSSLKHAGMVQELAQGMKENKYGKIAGGFVRAPIVSDSEYGGIYFYIQHGVQMMTEIFGNDAVSLNATKVGDTTTVAVHYPNYSVTILYTEHSGAYYSVVAGDSDTFGGTVTVDSLCFEKEFAEFSALLNGGEAQQTYAEFIVPVFIMNAIERSLASGEEERILRESI